MSGQPQPRTLFAGIGSQHGDDRIGWLVADALRERLPSDVEVRQASTPSQLLDWLGGIDRLVVCDACLAPAVAGTTNRTRLHRWDWPVPDATSLRSASSHAFGLPQVLQLAEQLGNLPAEVIVFGVEGSCFDAFADLSTVLDEAFAEIVNSMAEDLEAVHRA